MTTFDDCAHEPNDAGTGCRFCGLAARPVDRTELAAAMTAALAAIGAIAPRDCTCGAPAVVLDVEANVYRCIACALAGVAAIGSVRIRLTGDGMVRS